MPRKKVIKKGKAFASIHKQIDDDRKAEELNIESLDLVEHAGGSINNLPVKSKEFGTWLDAHRANNPFIGKHVTAAPEENTEGIKLDDDEILDDDEMIEVLDDMNEGASSFNPDSKYGNEVENLGDALKGDGDHDNKFIDLTIIENMTKKYLALSENEIKAEANRAIQTYHDNKLYETAIDIDSAIETSKVLFIEQKAQENTKMEQLKIESTKSN